MTILSLAGGVLTANHSGGVTAVLDTDAKLDAFLAANPDFFVSSDIDFPEEYTSDPAVLALVARVRS